MNEFETKIISAKKRLFEILESQREEEFNSTLEAAIGIVARSQAASETAKGNEPVSRKERTRFNQQIKLQEETF